MKHIEVTGVETIEVKRFCLPIEIELVCPRCGRPLVGG